MSEMNDIKSILPPNAETSVNVADDKRSAEKATPETSPSTQEPDKVSLTETATRLQSLQQQIKETPVVDQQRVAELKAAISEGSYKIDSQQLARKMIDFEGDF